MSKKLLTADEPISQEDLRNAVRDEVPATDAAYDGITANPFGDVSTQSSHRNEMAHNSAVWPEVTLWDESVAGTFKPAQHFHRCESVGDVIQVSAYLANTVITERNLENPAVTHYVTDKIAEGFAYRIGIVETVVEHAVTAELGWNLIPRELSDVSADESNGVDLRTADAKYNVKFENNNKTKKGVKRIDVTENDGELEIEIE